MTTPFRPPTSPMTPTQQLQIQLEGKKAQQASLQRQFDAINAQSKKLGGKPSKEKARLHAQALKIQAQLKKLNTDIPPLQNKVYEATGQYDKLLQGTERDAFMAINALFKTYNLESLAGKIFDYVKNGYSADTISILLQDTKEYKDRFSGNEARKAAGMPVLSPGEYLSIESSYRQIMSSAGLPPGFYDTPRDFSDFIAKDMSAQELQSRVDMATQATILAPPMYREALKRVGLGEGDMIAVFLDEQRAMPFLTKAVATAAIGAEALKQGLEFDVQYAGDLATSGLSAEQARQGYSQIGQELETMKNLGSIYGEQYGQREAEEAILGGKAGAIKKRGKLASQERAQFSGAAGAARGGLAQRGGQK